MCGIAGFINSVAGANRRTLDRMTESIRHRGPDDSGVYDDGTAWLGHRRLSIIDLALGHQPLSNEDGRYWIIYNGEIFNHAELRQDLEARGHRYRTRSDTETMVHAYEEYGPSCAERFRGMFSFVIWDHETRTLYCARDRLGKKPFYYYLNGRTFVFASEIKALLEHPAVGREPAVEYLAEYLSFGYLSGDETMFRGIRKLMPGHWMKVSFAETGELQAETRQYWDLPAPPPEVLRDEREWVEELRERLEEAVRSRLMSDVPLGVFLSGGLDSSAVAALMSRMVDGRVQSFSVGYREAAYSELDYARKVAEHLNTDHHEVVIGQDDFFRTLPALIWHEDEPISWPSSVSLYFVAKLAAERVKVVLTGEGSDELFGGYGRYRYHLLNQRLMNYYRLAPKALRGGVRRLVETSSLLPADLRRKLGHTVLARDESVADLLLDNFYGAFPGTEIHRLLGAEDHPYSNFLTYWSRHPDSDLLSRMLYSDQKTYLVELLMKQDQMSMACSIESRVPLLDHPLAEFAVRVPANLKLRGRSGKYIVKRCVADLLPPGIFDRPKMGFPTPLKQWLAGAGCDDVAGRLTRPGGLLAECLNLNEVKALIERHRSGLEDATDRLWRLLNLALWDEVFFTNRRPELPES